MAIMVSELYEALRAAGVEDALARRAAESVMAHDAALATKPDLTELRLTLRADLAEVNLTLHADLAEVNLTLRAELAKVNLTLRADLAEVKADLIKWNLGALVAMTGIFAAIVKLL
jgi:hypothetical protein